MFYVRTATEQDLPAVRQILVETWHATYDTIYGEDKVNVITASWHTLDQLKANRHRPDSEFLVADNGEVIGGMAYATHTDKTIFLHQLYVHPDHQGGRTGLHLLVEIENAFTGAETIQLEVDERNERAISFYSNYGFEVIDRTANCGQDDSGIPALIMAKPIVYAED